MTEPTPNSYNARNQVTVSNLKRCPLCGAVNTTQNEECFVCSWQGAFDTERSLVEEGLDELVESCPELAKLLSEKEREEKPKWWQRFFRRRLDLRV